MSETNKLPGPVVLDIAGTELSAEDQELLCHPQVGGVILFSRNYRDKRQLHDLIASIRALRSPLLLCVDHEGGRVQRFREGFTAIPAMQALGRIHKRDQDLALAYACELGWLMAVELLACDIDLSFAPVLDVDEDLSEIIGDRAFSDNPDTVAILVDGFITGMHDAGMAATGKHFPGHGGVVADSHLELPIDDRAFAALEARDLVPYRRLIHKLDAVMSAHILFPNVDADLVSYSKFWLCDYLRKALGFEGVIFSDDLSMAGATGAGDFADRAALSLAAGCDLVLVCNEREGAVAVAESLENSRHVSTNGRSIQSIVKRQAWSENQLRHSNRWHRAVSIARDLSHTDPEKCLD